MRTSSAMVISLVLALVVAACGTDTGTSTSEVDEVEATVGIAPGSAPGETATTAPNASTTTSTAGQGRGTFLSLVESGTVDVDIVSPEGGVSGHLLEVTLENTSQEEIDFVIPCGMVMVPDLAADQRMIALSETDVSLAPLGVVTVNPYVMCIDSGNAAPEAGADYDVGGLAGGALGQLADCVCAEDLGDLDPVAGELNLQMAVWAASEGERPSVGDGLAEARGALGDLLGSELEFDQEVLDALAALEGLDLEGIDLSAYGLEDFDFEAMMDQAESFLKDFDAGVADWFERCAIELGE